MQNTRLAVDRRHEHAQPHVRNVLQTYKTYRIPGWQFTAVMNIHTPTCGMLCQRIKHIEYSVGSLPPLWTYTTPRAECFANVSNIQNTGLPVHRRHEHTQPHVRNVLQTYKTYRIPGWQFTTVMNIYNPTCGMLCKRIEPTEYRVGSWPPSWTYTTPRAECFANVLNIQNTGFAVYHRHEHLQPHVRNALQTYRTYRVPGWQFTAVMNINEPT